MFCLLQPFFQRFLRCISKIKLKHVCIGVVVIALFDIFGAFTHMFELSYYDHFTYPYNGEIQPFVDALRHNKKPDIDPINEYNYSFIHGLKEKCADPDYATLRLVFLVKSAAEHFDRRNGIRQSWGFGKRFFDVPTITIFLLGVHPNDLELQAQINAESDEYNDILQADFIDSYYNNTIKTMLGFKWAVQHCRHSKFYMFVDDDMYVSVKNVLRFIRNPAYYPEYLKEPSRRAARKREIKDSDWTRTTADSWLATKEEINENENNQSSLITRISEGATAEEKIIMKQTRTSNSKTRIPIAKSSNEVLEESETELLKNKRKSLSHLMKLTENSTNSKKSLSREKRQIFAGTKEEINETENNQNSLITRISKRATAKEKIMMRRKPGWTSHNKTRFPIAKSSNEVLEESETELLKNKRKSSSHLMKLSENTTDSKKSLSREKRQIFAGTKEEINETENNQSSLIARISEGATAKEKIMMKRKPGWTSHNKTRFPTAKASNEVLEESKTELLKNERKSLSDFLKLPGNSTDSKKSLSREKRQIFDIELPDDVRLFAGYVIVSSPHRHRTSKWYVSLKEYPYHLWPPYVTAGAYILSKEGLLDMYYTSLYTQHFRFDDIFLGIVAKKADIEPFHCDEFHFYKKDYTKYNYKYVITSHGYDDPDELQQVWNEQKSLGNA